MIMRFFRNISIFVILLLVTSVLRAAGIADVHKLCGRGQRVAIRTSLVVEGVVISDWRSPNAEQNPQLEYNLVDLTVNQRTVYVQSPDGSYGLRLVFNTELDNRLERYSKVRLELSGTVLSCGTEAAGYTVEGMTAHNVLSVRRGTASDLVRKEKYISELTEQDLYTFVTLKEASAAFREGAWTNVWEPFCQSLPEIQGDKYKANGFMDGSASLLRDSQGSTIYMLVNTLCPWRRTGKKLPQGDGPVSGVIVNTRMLRYGNDMGAFSIRPVDESDLQIDGKPVWKCLTGWYLDGSAGESLEFELMGVQSGMRKNGRTNDRVINDVGHSQGFFWTDSNSAIHIRDDYNSLSAEDKGVVKNGALMFRGKTSEWFEWAEDGKVLSSKGFYVEFSPKKAKKAAMMQFNFEWCAGNFNRANANFPVLWGVECSIDGGAWQVLKETATGNDVILITALPWDEKEIGKKKYNTGYDCGMGPQQRSFALPQEALTAGTVVIRIAPVSTCISRFCKYPYNSYYAEDCVIAKGGGGTTVINFSNVSIDYR